MAELLRVRNPWDDSTVVELPFDDGRTLEDKLARAASAQRVWRDLPLDERVRRVQSRLAYFRDHAQAIAREVTAQMGKPLAQARSEVATMLDRAEAMVALAAEALAPVTLPEADGLARRIEHAPLGVVFDLAAWNYPLLIPVNVVVPALLAGNAVLLKHSALTPLCAARFESAFSELGPPGLVQSVVATHADCAALIRDPRIGHVAFTGSVAGGRAIQSAVSERFLSAGLELGGKDPAYVAADADLDFTVANVVDGACYNAGQSCCGIERVYVHESLYDEFLERAHGSLSAYRMGDPLDEATTLGPMAQAHALEELAGQVRGAQDAGARLLLGGEAVDGRFFAPTLLADCANDSAVMQEESFGPLLPVRSVASDEEALEAMNDSRFGLTASVWTADAQRAEHLARGLETGTVFQNRCDYLDPRLPWTGVKDSGMGSTLSRFGFLHLTRRKSLHFRVKT